MKVNFDIVLNTYYKVRKNIKNKKKIYYFELMLYSNINYIVRNINNNTYKLSRYNIFFIKEKKYRLILSNNIYDKIYIHLVNDLILYKLDKYLIDSNIASRKNKGLKYGRDLLHKYLCKLKSNKFYILKFDIKKYFFNIDHKVLMNKLSKYLNYDELNIINNLLNSTNELYINKEIYNINLKYNLDLPVYKFGKGLSIGSVVNEMLAVFYLNDLDRLIKENLECKYYIRYNDDGIILMEDKDKLKYVYEVLKKEIKNYKLEFNNKTKIYKSSEGFEYLGINYYIRNNKILKRISKRNKRKIINKINKNNYSYYKNYLKYVRCL